MHQSWGSERERHAVSEKSGFSAFFGSSLVKHQSASKGRMTRPGGGAARRSEASARSRKAVMQGRGIGVLEIESVDVVLVECERNTQKDIVAADFEFTYSTGIEARITGLERP